MNNSLVYQNNIDCVSKFNNLNTTQIKSINVERECFETSQPLKLASLNDNH